MDKEIKNKLVTRNSFRRYCRTVHFHLSFFFMGVILIYAVSGITMNHLKDFNPKYYITVNNYTVKGTFPTSHEFNKNEIIQLLKDVGGKSSVRCPLKPKRFYPLKIFNNAPSKSLDRWGYYYFSLFPSVCRHLPDTFSV